MTYNNSRIGEFSDPKAQSSNRDSIPLLETRSIKKDISTMFFSNNTKRTDDGKETIVESYMAEANVIDGEISPLNKMNISDFINIPIGINGDDDATILEYSFPYPTYNGKDHTGINKWTTGLSSSNFLGGSAGDTARTLYVQYAIFAGRAFDSLPEKKRNNVNSPFDVTLGSTISVTVPFKLDVQTEYSGQSKFKIVVPKIPVYGKISTGTFSSRRDSRSSKEYFNMPLPHTIFPVIYDIITVEDEGVVQLSGLYSDCDSIDNYNATRVLLEKGSGGRKTFGVLTREPFKTSLVDNENFKDIDDPDNEAESFGLDTYELLSRYNGESIYPFEDENLFMPIDRSYGNYANCEDPELNDFILDIKSKIYGIHKEDYLNGETTLIETILMESDLSPFGINIYEKQNAFISSPQELNEYTNEPNIVGKNRRYLLKIDYKVVRINNVSNSVLASDSGVDSLPAGIGTLTSIDIPPEKRFYHGAEEMFSLMPTGVTMSYETYNGSSYNSIPENGEEKKINMIMTEQQDILINSNNDESFKSTDYPKTMDLIKEPFLLYSSKDSSELIIGLIAKEGNSIMLLSLFHYNGEGHYSKTKIYLGEASSFDSISVKVNEFRLLYDQGQDKTMYSKITYTLDGVTYLTKELSFSSSMIDSLSYSFLEDTGVSDTFMFTSNEFKEIPNNDIVRNLSISSEFCDNSYYFSGIPFRGATHEDNDYFFRKAAAYSLYQRYALNADGLPLVPPRDTENDSNDDDDPHEYIAEYRPFHLAKTSPVYSQQSNLKVIAGDMCFGKRIDVGNILLSIGETTVLFSREYFRQAVAGYSVSGGLVTGVNMDIIPIRYPIPMFFKNNTFEHTLVKLFNGAERKNQYVYSSVINDNIQGSSLRALMHDDSVFDVNNHIGSHEFLMSMKMTNYTASHLTSSMLSLNVQDILSCGNILRKTPADNYGDEIESISGHVFTGTTGVLMVSKNPRVIEGGALENMSAISGFTGVDLTKSSIVYGLGEVKLMDKTYLLSGSSSYEKSSMFKLTSTFAEKLSSPGVSLYNNQIYFSPYLFSFDDNSGITIIYSDRNVISQVFTSAGKMVRDPFQDRQSIYFQYILLDKVYFCKLENGDVHINSIFTIDDMIKSLPSTVPSDCEYSISTINNRLSYKPLLLFWAEDASDNKAFSMFSIDRYGTTLMSNIKFDFSHIVFTYYLGSGGIPLLISDKNMPMEFVLEEYSASDLPVMKIKTAPVDVSYGLEYYFIPTGIEIFFRPYEKDFSDEGGSLSITIKDATNDEVLDSQDVDVIFSNGKSRHIMNFVLDINTINSFYFEVEFTNIIARNISLHGYLINKD
ncbi:MAG: hypothetical protein WC175_01070 [Candidatus Dojkabacteria bacterium]